MAVGQTTDISSPASKPDSHRRLVVLGSTGSIGENTLRVVEHLNQQQVDKPIEVIGLAAGRNGSRLVEQAQQWKPRFISLADDTQAEALRQALPGVTVLTGERAAYDMVEAAEPTDVAAAVVGAAGLKATLAAIEKGARIHLANKETLVAAGELVMPHLRKYQAELLPVDSEHSAIFQCITEHPTSEIKRLVLTASGGPFRTWEAERIRQAGVAEALAHPTWKMGRKITIDSASMTNKALEVIEAHWLFNLPGEQIDVIVHPQSVIHSFVEFADNSVLAQLGPPDMKTPIQYAMTYPKRAAGCSQAMDWRSLNELTFEQADFDKFPALKLAYEVIEAGGTAGAVFNAANEEAVDAFLNEKIAFGQISEFTRDALSGVDQQPIQHLSDVLEADAAARRYVRQRLGQSDLQTTQANH